LAQAGKKALMILLERLLETNTSKRETVGVFQTSVTLNQPTMMTLWMIEE
jgi:hypothetical protein